MQSDTLSFDCLTEKNITFESKSNSVNNLLTMSGFPQISSTEDSPPTKRKRGRPPKATSLTSQITTRININVNTSPLSSSPTAESNSNMIVKQGAPDCFTPLMRVSPSRKKKRRSSSSSSTGNSTPNKTSKSKSNQATPSSSTLKNVAYTPYGQINSKTLDNISYITQSDNPPYNTPPNSVLRSGVPNSADSFKEGGFPYKNATLSSYLIPSSKEESRNQDGLLLCGNDLSKSLLPSASMEYPKLKDQTVLNESAGSSLATHGTNAAKFLSNKSNGFSLKLMINDMGKAVLSKDLFNSDPTRSSSEVNESLLINETKTDEPARSLDQLKPKRPNSVLYDTNYLGSQQTHTSVIPSDSALNEAQIVNQSYQPSVLRRLNSDITGYSSTAIPSSLYAINEAVQSTPSEKSMDFPQTPKYKENYFYSTGLTPSNSISFNLTPQFNSLMYSTMNNNSPQKKKVFNNHQFMMNQEIFMNGSQGNQQMQSSAHNTQNTINMSEIMSLTDNSSSFNKNEQAAGFFASSQVDSTSSNSSSSSSSAANNADDSGDARLALKKIIYVKRK